MYISQLLFKRAYQSFILYYSVLKFYQFKNQYRINLVKQPVIVNRFVQPNLITFGIEDQFFNSSTKNKTLIQKIHRFRFKNILEGIEY